MNSAQAQTRYILRIEGTGSLKGKDARSLCVSTSCTPASVRNRIVQGFGLNTNSTLECYDAFRDGEHDILLDMDLDSVVHSILDHMRDGTPPIISNNTLLVDCKACVMREEFNANSPNEYVTPVMVATNKAPKKTRTRKEWVEKMDGLWPVHIWR